MNCRTMVVVDTDSNNPITEVDLMNMQEQNNRGIFECEENDTFSDQTLTLSNGSLHLAKPTGCYVITGIFSDAWRVIKAEAKKEQ